METANETEVKTEWQLGQPLKPAWGITPPPDCGASAAWGARAIYHENHQAYKENHTKAGKLRKRGLVPWYFVELVWDRQGAAGRNADLLALNEWVNKVGLPRLRAECEIPRDSEKTLTFSDGRFTMTASPRASYGYLYIGAWVR